MPTIRPSADLRNNYNEISEFCHRSREPVFITKNGRGDLAVLSMQAYQELIDKFELYRLLGEGLADIAAGRTRPVEEFIAELDKEYDFLCSE